MARVNFFHTLLVLSIINFSNPVNAMSQTGNMIGFWKTYDKTTKTISIIETYLENDLLSARIVNLLDHHGNSLDPICNQCNGALEGKPIKGMRFVWGLKEFANKRVGGFVLDLRPGLTQGRIVASCKMEMIGDSLKITGYWGIFSGSDNWERLKNQDLIK